MASKSAWTRLAEGLGMKDEAGGNWSKLAQQRNMQRYGTQDRRTQVGPTPYFKPNGLGSAQRPSTMSQMSPDMTPRQGGLQIPAGTDKPGQLNALYMQPRPGANTAPKASPLSTSPNSPAARNMGMTGEPEPETDDDEQNPGDNPGGRL